MRRGRADGGADPFARWRARQAQHPERPPAAAPDEPVAVYEAVNYHNRAWLFPMLLVWLTLFGGLVYAFIVYEREIHAATAWATPLMTLGFLAGFASIFLVFVLLCCRRRWRLYADRLEIEQDPIWPLTGPRVRATLKLEDIAAARRADLIGGLVVVKILTRDGRRYRLSPKTIASGKASRIDHDGFESFIDAIADAIATRGLVPPPGEKLKTLWDSGFGFGLLAALLAVTLGCGAGIVWFTFALGEPRLLNALFVVAIFASLFWSLLAKKWRERRTGA